MRADPPSAADEGFGPPGTAHRVLVLGTATDVGKTWVAAELLRAWRRVGVTVAARKAAQSFEPGSGPTDAEVLGQASGEAPEAVCPPDRWYPVPMAPPMAADALGLPPPTIEALLSGLVWPDEPVDVALLETAGGVRSPQAVDADAADVVAAWPADGIVLVSGAGLGVIDDVQLAVEQLPVMGPGSVPLTVVLNRFDGRQELHWRNLEWLADRLPVPVVAVVPGALDGLAAALVEAGGGR